MARENIELLLKSSKQSKNVFKKIVHRKLLRT